MSTGRLYILTTGTCNAKLFPLPAQDTLTRGFVSSIAKKGWLFKGPDSGKDNIISFTRVNGYWSILRNFVLFFLLFVVVVYVNIVLKENEA